MNDSQLALVGDISENRVLPSEMCWSRLESMLAGRGRWFDVLEGIRRAMLQEALNRTGGNLTKTASLLGVKRQAVQQMVSRYSLQERVRELAGRPHKELAS